MTKRGAAGLKRRISQWLEVTRGSRVPIGITPRAALRRARQIRRQILDDEIASQDFVLDEDTKSVLHALVRLVTQGRPKAHVTGEVRKIRLFLNGIVWRQDVLGEKEELQRELELAVARLGLIGKGKRVPDRWASLPPGDPFRQRPKVAEDGSALDPLSLVRHTDPEIKRLSRRIVDAAFGPSENAGRFIASLDLESGQTRLALLLALRGAGTEVGRDPVGLLQFAQLIQQWLAKRLEPADDQSAPVSVISNRLLSGHALRLAGLAYISTGSFAKAGPPLTSAYRCLGQTISSSFDFAAVEIVESQRRSFLGRGREALKLAARVERTFRELGLRDYVARAWVARGVAMFALQRWGQALEAYRRAIPEFESRSLWSNYIGAVNSAGFVLTRLGRFEEASSSYAKALRRFDRDQHASWLPLVRHGLAELLFAAGRYREAAHTFQEVGTAIGHLPFGYLHLKWGLQEVESWARAGEIGYASERLEKLQAQARRVGALEPSQIRGIKRLLMSHHPNLERLGQLRERLQRNLMVGASRLPRRKNSN